MLERICIPAKYHEGTHFDLGLLAEALIFYGEVSLIVKAPSLSGLLKQCTPETLLRFLEHGRLKIKYLNNMLGAISKSENTPYARYDFGLISSEKLNLENAAHTIFKEATGKSGRGRRLANRFLRLAEPISYEESITNEIKREVQDGKYISEYIERRLKKNPDIIGYNLNKALVFRFGRLTDGGFPLQTNINFNELKKLNLQTKELKKPSSILAHYGTTIADLSLWSRFDTEVAVNSSEAEILQSRFDVLLNKRKQSHEAVRSFQDLVFDDGKAIRNAINTGKRSLDDLFPVIERSGKFCEWLRDQPVDKEIIKSYYKEVTSDSWVDKLPGKTTRWAIFTGAGLGIDLLGGGGIGTSIGVTLSALDYFVVDKLIKGWKPNQFIHGELETFVKH